MATAQNFELGLLPERKLSWRTLASSYGFVAFLLLIVVNISLIWPDRLQLIHDYHVTELIPLPSVQPKPIKLKPQRLRAKLLPPAPVFDTPKLTVPKELRASRVVPHEVAPPKIVTGQFAAPEIKVVPGGARLAKVVRTGEFGSSAAPTLNVAIGKVQTGGFGDPNGVKPQSNSNARATIASVGGFDMPQGPGQGNGTGGAHGLKGTVASAGFGSGIAQPGQGDGRSNGRGVQTAAFGSEMVAQGPAHSRQMDSGPATTPVEITSKPNPVYTQEARQLKLEGEVLLDVNFGSNGQLHVIRVVRGLGHGLDESALAAANMIRFKPALRNGVPVDSTAVVHVEFRLAY